MHPLFIRTIAEWFNFVCIIFRGFHEMNTFMEIINKDYIV